jgi:hypothetical protein
MTDVSNYDCENNWNGISSVGVTMTGKDGDDYDWQKSRNDISRGGSDYNCEGRK